MSYNPEPDPDKEFPRLAALRERFISFATKRPVALALRMWLFFALFSALMLVTDGLDAFDTPGRKLILLIAMLGLVVPFIEWIRAKKAEEE